MGAPASIYELTVSWITLESRSCSTFVTSCHGCKDLTTGHYGCHAWMLRKRFDMVLSFGKYFLLSQWAHSRSFVGLPYQQLATATADLQPWHISEWIDSKTIPVQVQDVLCSDTPKNPGSGIAPPPLFRRKAPPLATRPGATSRLERYDTISTCRCRAGNAPALVDPLPLDGTGLSHENVPSPYCC